jgi:hypothetical protein
MSPCRLLQCLRLLLMVLLVVSVSVPVSIPWVSQALHRSARSLTNESTSRELVLTYDQSRSVLSVKHVREYHKASLREQICGSPCAVEDEEPHASAEGLCEAPVHEGGEVGVEACEQPRQLSPAPGWICRFDVDMPARSGCAVLTCSCHAGRWKRERDVG